MAPWESIQRSLNHFPEAQRGRWLASACQTTGLPLPDEYAGLSLLPGNHDPANSPPWDAAILLAHLKRLQPSTSQLVQLAHILQDLTEAARQARWIRYLLIRRNVSSQWLEAWAEAIEQPEVVQCLQHSAPLTAWVAQSLDSQSPPNLFEAIPGLDQATLKLIRKSIDRSLKRYLRQAARRQPVDSSQLLDEPTTETDTLWLKRAVERLDRQSQTAIYLRYFENQTLESIASQIGLRSPTQVHRLLADALAKLRQSLDSQ